MHKNVKVFFNNQNFIYFHVKIKHRLDRDIGLLEYISCNFAESPACNRNRLHKYFDILPKCIYWRKYVQCIHWSMQALHSFLGMDSYTLQAHRTMLATNSVVLCSRKQILAHKCICFDFSCFGWKSSDIHRIVLPWQNRLSCSQREHCLLDHTGRLVILCNHCCSHTQERTGRTCFAKIHRRSHT